ncbi:galactoside O-acetyltransferase [Paramagnetospirillum marisnigri]|uniref:Chloramphenicol acetyltransferase n=1 Tax=Paramagnetospirillum marisnigri TaxID=1285242 RepID=A0A178MKS8_9PROT|nr:acyltransferase [Paramagnetospirillum marisnigri]OAN49331.1 galactoside O-acetyltransferase [Paramagnetospirillum marisnigri]
MSDEIPQHPGAGWNPFDQGYFSSDELRQFGFKEVGRNVMIAKNATIIGLANISIGNNVRIDGGVTIVAQSGRLALHDFIHIGSGCHLNCAGGITMSSFSGLSQGVRIYSGTDDYTGESLTNPTVPGKYAKTKIAPVELGRHVIIGSGTVILPGVTIGEGASVGALSLVPKSLDDWWIHAGIPAQKMRQRSRALLALEQRLMEEIV